MSISPFRYPGAKSKKNVMEKIKKYFPSSFDHFYEPMCGGASMSLSINPKSVKTIWMNDIDDNLISVFLELKNNPNEFIKKCKQIEPHKDGEELTSARLNGKPIYNKRLKNKFYELLNNPTSDKALKFLFINRTVWMGRVNFREPSQMYFSVPEGWNIVKTDRLEKVAEIVKNIKITFGDYRPLLQDNADNVLCFIDPPYFVNTFMPKKRQLYAYGFSVRNHIELRNEIRKSKHKILITYDDCPQVRKLYKEEDGFYLHSEKWTYSGCPIPKDGKISLKTGKELIITNYEVSEKEGKIF